VNVETAADGSGTPLAATNLNIGNSITVYAIGRAADNSFIGNAQATWFLTNATGSVIGADLVPSGDGKSASFTAHAIGSARIAAASGVATVNPSATVTVVAAAPANDLVWTGGTSSDWDLVTFNWTNLVAGLSTNFAQLDRVRFDDTSFQTFVNVTAPVLQADVVVDTATTYTFSGPGAIGGIGSVTKAGAGILVLSTTNTYDGVTTISNGTVQLGDAKGLGSTYSGTVIESGATLDLNGTVNAATGEAITVSGAGANLVGAIVNDGASLFNQSFNNAPVTFAGDTTIGGNGRFDFNGGSFAGNGYKLTKTGGNSVVFSNNGETDLGDIEIQSGGLTFVGNVTLGRANSNLVVQPATTLDFFAVNNTNALVKNIAVTNGTISTSSGTTWLDTPIVFDTALTLGGSGNTIVSNVIAGSTGVLTKSGAGTVTLFAANDFSGGTAHNGGILKVENDGALGTGAVTVTAPASSQATRIDLANGVNFTNDVVTFGRNTGFNGIIFVPGANDVATNSGSITCNGGNVPSGAGGHLCGPSGTNGMLHVLGPIIQGSDTPAIRNGFVRLYGGGSGSGFIINQGTTSLGATDGINPAATLSLAASGLTVLDLNGFNQSLAGLVRGANVAVVTNSAANLGTLTLNIAADQAFTGVLAGEIAVVKSGVNALTNSGANTYTGETTVQQGILSLPNPNLARAATVRIDAGAGAGLELTFSGTNVVAGLVISGVPQADGVYNAGNTSGAITGTGSLLVAPFSTTPTNLTATVTGGTLDLSWPITHLGWIASSNSVDISNSNLWFDIPGSKDVNTLAVTIDPAKTNVFYRLRLP
jgi:fibronectin-binding autotransporter adhesin